MGVAVGDYDNDGWPDLFVTGYGADSVQENRDGTFTDVTRKAGLETPGWTTSAVWFDYDNDGNLDLFVCRFVPMVPASSVVRHNKLGKGYYCIPRFFRPTATSFIATTGMAPSPQVPRAPISRGLSAKVWVLSRQTSITTVAWTYSSQMTPCRTSYL